MLSHPTFHCTKYNGFAANFKKIRAVRLLFPTHAGTRNVYSPQKCPCRTRQGHFFMHIPLHQMASDVVVIADVAKFRYLLLALLDGERAPRMELAAGRRIRRIRNVAAQHDPLALQLRDRNRHRRQQRLRVRVKRIAEQLVPRSRFHHRAEVHDADAGT